MDIYDILRKIAKMRATDLHLVVGMRPMGRVRGKLVAISENVLTPEDTDEYVQTILAPEQLQVLWARGEIDYSLSIRGLNRFRINIFRQRGTYSLACRVVMGDIPSFDSLGMPDAVKELCMRQRGLVLVTGPSGAGKTATLAAMIDYINHNRDAHIITIEEPIEYFHNHDRSIVNQREIGMDSQTYATALHSALKQDPDVILIGDMMALDTISVALSAAETGVLVLAEMHTPGSVQAVDRLIDVFPLAQQQQTRVQLSMLLQGIVYQQLISSTEGEMVAAVEMLLATSTVRNLIREGKTPLISDLLQTPTRDGMCSMDNALCELYRCGRITRENAIAYAVDPSALQQMFQRA